MSDKVPNIVASLSVTNQSGNISSTTAYTPSADGVYRITCYSELQNYGSLDGIGIHFTWTDLGNNVVSTSPNFLFGPGAQGTNGGVVTPDQATAIVGLKGSTNLTYSTSTSLTAGATYSFYIIVESLQ